MTIVFLNSPFIRSVINRSTVNLRKYCFLRYANLPSVIGRRFLFFCGTDSQMEGKVYNQIYFDVAPSVSSGMIVLNVNSSVELPDTRIEITDMNGSIVEELYQDFHIGENKLKIVTQGYINGMYLLRGFTLNGDMYRVKFIKN